MVYSRGGWESDTITEIMDMIMIVRAKQIINYKQTCNQEPQNFFNLEINKLDRVLKDKWNIR